MIDPSDELRAFWAERHFPTLTTLRPDGLPHVVPVGVTVDEEFAVARVITFAASVKARNVRPGDVPVAVSQADGRRWSTLEGRARLLEDPESVRDAENRYAVRYQRQPRPKPDRVVIEIRLTRRLGMR
ncbi:acyltransferase [Amycolatopsis albispora]|uniref:Acyltransferase n=1 Tax=Amycolatopsis albispora TaxID=1804986 RepID=A0A344L4W2_9PSEU|nr:acyltransferase [Amycolatopsis albispora]